MNIHEELGYSFQFRSGGVVVLKGDEYIGFYDNIELAFKHVFGLPSEFGEQENETI